MISRRAIKISEPAEVVVVGSGLAEALQLRLFRRMQETLTSAAVDALRRKRVPDDSECFPWRAVIATPQAWHVFTFHVNDTMYANALVVESATHTTRPPKR